MDADHSLYDVTIQICSSVSFWQVVLIHDPETDKEAAAMDVRVGQSSDPPHLQGTAHFCEHMLFLGTGKYPDENCYNAFLNSHGGSSNAYTSDE
ncbi:unnamed protein product, partial [Discosporangium mesarthrocarpum]